MSAAPFHACVMQAATTTAVTGSVAGSFTAAGSRDLLVARGTTLCLYTWDGPQEALRITAELALPARVVTMAAIPAVAGVAGAVDTVALCFDEQHVSVIAFDAATMQFVTLACHLLTDPAATPTTTSYERGVGLPPILRVDPGRRCIAVLTHREFLFVVPLSGSSGAKVPGDGAGVAVAAAANDDDDEERWADEDDTTAEPAPVTTDAADTQPSGRDALSTVVAEVQHRARCVHLPVAVSPHLRNIRDMQFVAATEPSLVFLRELDPVWAGRIRLANMAAGATQLKALSCGVTFVTVDCSSTKDTVKTLVVSEVEGLSYGSTGLFPVPDPLGGAFVVAPHSVTHVTSKGSCYTAALNAHGREELQSENIAITRGDVRWPYAPADDEGVLQVPVVEVSGAEAYAVSDRRLLLAGADSTLYFVELDHNGREVSGIDFVKAPERLAAAQSIATVAPGLLFLGSATTDSVLARFDNGVDAPMATMVITAVAALPHFGPIVDWAVADSATPDAAGAVRRATAAQGAPGHSFDALMGKKGAVLEAPPVVYKEQVDAMELAACGGRDRQGQIVVRSRTVRMDAVMRMPIDCVSAFAVNADAADLRAAQGEPPAKKAAGEDPAGGAAAAKATAAPVELRTVALLVSTRTATLVVDSTLTQVSADRTPFVTNLRTVAAGMVTPSVMAQVTTEGAVLVALSDTPTEVVGRAKFHDTVRHAVLHAGAVYALLHNGAVHRLAETNGKWAVSDVTAAVAGGVDDEITALVSVAARGLLLAFRADATLAITHAPTATGTPVLAATVPRFACLPRFTSTADPTLTAPEAARPVKLTAPPQVVEGVATTLSSQAAIQDAATTVALLTASGELAVYRLTCAGPATEAPEHVVFEKTQQCPCDVEPGTADSFATLQEKQRRKAEAELEKAQDRAKARSGVAKLTVARNVGGVNAVLVAGRVPQMVVSDRGMPRVHPIRFDTPASGFAEVHTAKVAAGIVACGDCFLQFGLLPLSRLNLSLRAPWPVRRVKLFATPHAIAYVPAERAAVVALSTSQPYRPTKAPFDVEHEMVDGQATVVQALERKPVCESEGIPIPTGERYTIALFNANGWTKAAEYNLLENETVVCLTTASIGRPPKPGPSVAASCVDSETKVEVVAVGTAFCAGEDAPCRGRLLVFTVKADSLGQRRLQLVHAEPTKGPVTAITGFRGGIVAAVGATVKLLCLDWGNSKMVTACFLQTPTFVTDITAFKDFLFIGDMHCSTTVARFTREGFLLTPLARDTEPATVIGLDVCFRDGKASLATFDAKDNIMLQDFTPTLGADGQLRLSNTTPVGHFKAGGAVTRLRRIRAPNTARTAPSAAAAVYYTTSEGELGRVQPLLEKSHRTLRYVAAKVEELVAQPAGLHPTTATSGRVSCTQLCGGDPLLDGTTLRRFLMLSHDDRNTVARRAATTPQRVVQLLAQAEAQSDLF